MHSFNILTIVMNRNNYNMVCLHILKDIPLYITIVMSVNTHGHTVCAHESLSFNEIVDIIQHREDLISKFVQLT